MSDQPLIAARLAMIEKEVADLRRRIEARPRGTPKSLYGAIKGARFEIDDFKAAARGLFGESR